MNPASQAVAAVLRRPVLYPDRYAWYILVSALDLMMTNTVINYFGAREVNTIADVAIGLAGFWGLIALKFATVALVVMICERVGRKHPVLGGRVAGWAVAVSALPVVATLAQIVVDQIV